jgi:nucleoid DNA-binding protein
MDFEGWEKATWRLLEDRSPAEADRDYTHAEVRTVMEAAMQALVQELVGGGGQLTLSDFGRIHVSVKNPRQMVSNLGGESRVYQIPARRGICFRPSQALVDLLNNQ